MFDKAEAVAVIRRFQGLMDRTPREAAHVRLGPDAWTLAEIVGHLIDSAGNNHQRFARLRLGDLEGFPGYAAEPWVAAQEYDSCAFADLAALWTGYNALLLHLAERTPAEAGGNAWLTPEGRKTLDFLVEDYYAHLALHVEQYAARLDEVLAALGFPAGPADS
ncbi:DinB family protein [Desulfocurvus sp. DL9XJH121]